MLLKSIKIEKQIITVDSQEEAMWAKNELEDYDRYECVKIIEKYDDTLNCVVWIVEAEKHSDQ